MESIGQDLKHERELRGMSVEELAKVTRIPAKNLDLLEAGRFEALPGDVFTKGFIRAYARAVGTNADKFVERFERTLTPEVEPIPAPMTLVQEPEHNKRFGVAIVVVILLILFTLALSIVLQPRQRNTPVELSQGSQQLTRDTFGKVSLS